jgi:hypothetical protein
VALDRAPELEVVDEGLVVLRRGETRHLGDDERIFKTLRMNGVVRVSEFAISHFVTTLKPFSKETRDNV